MVEMKANEWILTIVQVAAPITAFAFGVVPMVIFLSLWLIAFGIAELVSKAKTGKTLSQHVWTLPMWKRLVLSIVMIAGMIVLGYHFVLG